MNFTQNFHEKSLHGIFLMNIVAGGKGHGIDFAVPLCINCTNPNATATTPL